MENIILYTLLAVFAYITVYQNRTHNKREAELLDRLMARNLPEFERVQLIRDANRKPRVFHCMNDEEMAEYEKSKKALALVSGNNTSLPQEKGHSFETEE